MTVVNLDLSGGLAGLEMSGERVRVQLQKIVTEIDPELLEALLEAADFMKVMAKIYVRVDTGSLQKSIRVERTAPTYHHHVTVRVRAGGYIVNPKSGRLVDYAGYVESKYPYMKPAWQNVQGFVEAKVDEAMERLTR